MLFSSYIFILIFLPIVFIGYYGLLKFKYNEIAKAWLVLSSFFFYGYWKVEYLPLILLSIIVNYQVSNEIRKDRTSVLKKVFFFFGLAFNIGLLGYFKYRDFFIENINSLASTSFHFEKLALPLGISFFTLQQIAYIIDTFEGISPKKKLIDYSLFVSFFPQLIAGPIVHYQEVMPQFESQENKKFIAHNVALGIFIFVLGLSKKVLLADTFAFWANEGFAQTSNLHLFSAWGTSLSYTFQLYFDFSGYSDMAIGLGYLFNIKIPKNFNSPFHSRNIIEFWTRWHMTLSQFINTYIFTPLVKSMPKFSFRNSMISIFITMLIAGLWHGAAWTFVLYGALHGLAIVINHNMKKKKIKLPKWLAVFLTFQFINFVFIVFRAKTLSDALNLLKGMLGLQGVTIPKGILPRDMIKEVGVELGQYMNNDQNLNLLMIIASFIIVYKFKNTMQMLDNFKADKKYAVITGFLFVLSLFGLNRISEFIYFNF